MVKGRAAPSIVSVKDKIHHGQLRKPIAALYSNTNVQSYQPRVTETIKYFLKRLDEEFIQGDMAGRRCDIENWVQYCEPRLANPFINLLTSYCSRIRHCGPTDTITPPRILGSGP